MIWKTAALILAFCSAGAAALAGPPLPAPYRAAQTVQAGKVAVTAAHATLRVPSGVEGQDTLREIHAIPAGGRAAWQRPGHGESDADPVRLPAPRTLP